MNNPTSPIAEAIAHFGSQEKLALAIGKTQAAVSKWARGHKMLVENALAVERATGGRVKAESLCPEAFAGRTAA